MPIARIDRTTTKLKPGTKVWIRVNSRRRLTVIDENGVQRFRRNRIMDDMHEVAAVADQSHRGSPPWDGPLSLNEASRQTRLGKYTRNELREFYRLLGISVQGYLEVFVRDDVRNPVEGCTCVDGETGDAYSDDGCPVHEPEGDT